MKMRVSIVICNYNYADFLEQAIRSAVEQTYSNLEVIVVDDGSTDHSREIIERWSDRVQPVFKSNAGQISACNTGFERVSGDVVIFLDSDDFLDPGTCAEVVSALSDDVAKVHFRLRLVDEQGKSLGGVIPRKLAEGNVGPLLLEQGEMYASSPGSGNAYRVATLKRLMPIEGDAAERHGADFFLALGSALLGNVKSLGASPRGSYRVHKQQDASDLLFGNARKREHEPLRTQRRYTHFQRWIQRRLGDTVVLPPLAPDFSLEKQGFVLAIFQAADYPQGVLAGASYMKQRLFPAISRAPGLWPERLVLAGWATAVLLLPRKVGVHIARYGCNPASR